MKTKTYWTFFADRKESPTNFEIGRIRVIEEKDDIFYCARIADGLNPRDLPEYTVYKIKKQFAFKTKRKTIEFVCGMMKQITYFLTTMPNFMKDDNECNVTYLNDVSKPFHL